jgi:hypothetical protein
VDDRAARHGGRRLQPRAPGYSAPIVAPRAARRDRQVKLVAAASDADDGPFSDRSLVWTSSRDGRVGTGSALIARLSPGRHTVTVTATDSDGNKVTATSDVTVAAGRIPAAPSHVRAVVADGVLTIRWRDVANGETHYFVERARRARIPVFRTVARLPQNAQAYVDRTARGPVLYRVRACNAQDCSRFAGPVGVRLPTR